MAPMSVLLSLMFVMVVPVLSTNNTDQPGGDSMSTTSQTAFDRDLILKQIMGEDPPEPKPKDIAQTSEVLETGSQAVCPVSNTEQFTAGCVLASMAAWNLRVIEVSSLGSVVSECNKTGTDDDCQLRVCCAGHQALKCLQFSGKDCEKPLAKGYDAVNVIISQTCPKMLLFPGLPDLCPVQWTRRVNASIKQTSWPPLGYKEQSQDPMEMVRMDKEPNNIERITIQLRFGNGSPNVSVAPLALLSALIAVRFHFC